MSGSLFIEQIPARHVNRLCLSFLQTRNRDWMRDKLAIDESDNFKMRPLHEWRAHAILPGLVTVLRI